MESVATARVGSVDFRRLSVYRSFTNVPIIEMGSADNWYMPIIGRLRYNHVQPCMEIVVVMATLLKTCTNLVQTLVQPCTNLYGDCGSYGYIILYYYNI